MTSSDSFKGMQDAAERLRVLADEPHIQAAADALGERADELLDQTSPMTDPDGWIGAKNLHIQAARLEIGLAVARETFRRATDQLEQ